MGVEGVEKGGGINLARESGIVDYEIFAQSIPNLIHQAISSKASHRQPETYCPKGGYFQFVNIETLRENMHTLGTRNMFLFCSQESPMPAIERDNKSHALSGARDSGARKIPSVSTVTISSNAGRIIAISADSGKIISSDSRHEVDKAIGKKR
ncbi:MAG: hypothetical protein RL120_06255 [Gammaproteobacteria bacterium]